MDFCFHLNLLILHGFFLSSQKPVRGRGKLTHDSTEGHKVGFAKYLWKTKQHMYPHWSVDGVWKHPSGIRSKVCRIDKSSGCPVSLFHRPVSDEKAWERDGLHVFLGQVDQTIARFEPGFAVLICRSNSRFCCSGNCRQFVFLFWALMCNSLFWDLRPAGLVSFLELEQFLKPASCEVNGFCLTNCKKLDKRK